MRVNVITLERTPERFRAFVAQNTMPGLEIAALAALDGRTLDRAKLVADGLVAEDLIYTAPALGCALSHLGCWQLAARGTAPFTICEDDAALRRDFVDMHAQLLAAVPDFDVIFWGFNFDMHVAVACPGIGDCVFTFDEEALRSSDLDEFQNARPVARLYRARRLFGLPCYTVSPAGARKLLARCLPVRNSGSKFRLPNGAGGFVGYLFNSQGIDVEVGVMQVTDLEAYVAVPPIAVSPNDKSTSTIGGQDRDVRTQSAPAG